VNSQPGFHDVSSAYLVAHHLLSRMVKQPGLPEGYRGRKSGIVLIYRHLNRPVIRRPTWPLTAGFYQEFYNLFLDQIYIGSYPADLFDLDW